jgi:uncharacterized protein
MATMVTMTTLARTDEPDGAPRLAGLDVLRGLAILAILFMNINDMGGSLFVLFVGEIRHFGWSAADQAAWFVREVLANSTARCLLEMLFGAGMVILTDRAAQGAASRWAVLRSYWWRSFVLFLLGVIHIFVLLWPGDILHTYGLAAMVAVLFRRLRPRWLLTIGLSMAVLQLGGGGFGYYQATQQRAAVAAAEAKQAAGRPLTKAETATLQDDAKQAAGRAKREAEGRASIAAEDKARTGTSATWAQSAWDSTWWIQSRFLEILFVWEAAATMLIGAALFKLGILQGARSRGFYVKLTLVAYAIGLGSRTVGALDEMRFDDAPSIIWSLSEVARLATTLGHVGLVYLLLGTVMGARLLRPFQAAGRVALSLYILQTIICLWILYPPFALGLYGTQSWWEMMATALLINAGLLWLANWYAARFTAGPVEWAWRSAVERRVLPFGRRDRGVKAVPAAV